MAEELTSLPLRFYSVLSALFFGACAYAQSNDPDPELWVAGYLIAGCVMNVLVTQQSRFASILVRGIALTNAIVAGAFIRNMIPMLDLSLLSKSPLQFAWSVLELEEGREVVGLLLLLGHGSFLQSQIQSKGSSRQHGNSRLGPVLLALGFVATASFAWVYYQPAMNAKYQVEHCSGQFHPSLDSDSTQALSNEL